MNFEKLNVWKESVTLSSQVYIYFAQCRDFGFKDQITRSSLSVPSNISEGMVRESDKEKCHYINIALGSCAELRTQIYVGLNINYIDDTQAQIWVKHTKYIAAMLIGLRKSIRGNMNTLKHSSHKALQRSIKRS
ncbi:four helix bundle protein [Thalassotalea sp. LPB0316]|uniref:four helix bundle protein n=1 Tax=Thalassotalea sp. LPB0316 TaxID=2769490 RepID=UPI0018694A77|nr:four helix bundle protein [Thalassotalea sp. LPB0316]QOL24427.1 four helix bundle protein [Thalassotalea sp. LPB0316]